MQSCATPEIERPINYDRSCRHLLAGREVSWSFHARQHPQRGSDRPRWLECKLQLGFLTALHRDFNFPAAVNETRLQCMTWARTDKKTG